MGCCKSDEKDPELFISGRSRYCTDVAFLILFICSWGAGITLAAVSVNKDPSLIDDILYPVDSYGNNCGKPGSVTATMPKVFYPTLDQDLLAQIDIVATYRYWEFTPTRLCATECPSGFNLADPVMYGGPDYPCGYDSNSTGATCSAGTVPSSYYIFVTQDVISRCMPFDDNAQAGSRSLCATPNCTDAGYNCTAVPSYPDVKTAWEIDVNDQAQKDMCQLVIKESTSNLFAPEDQTPESLQYTTNFANYMQQVIGGINGLLVTEAVIVQALCGLLMPVLLAFVWAVMLWFFAGVLVWVLITLLVLVSLAGCFYFMYKAGWFGDSIDFSSVYNSTLTAQAQEDEQTWYAVLAVVFLVLTGIEILFFIMSRKALARLVAIIKECTKVFKAMTAIVLWPIFVQLPFELGVYFYGFFISYFIVMVWSDTATMVTFVVLHFFLIIWTVLVIKATIWAAMSAAVGVWFTKINAPGSEAHGVCGVSFGCGELWGGTGLILSKHLGSMAFGSLIIGICQMIRYILTAIDYYTQDLQDKNLLLKIVMKCSQCVMWCLQKTIEFISYFGYIFVACRGSNFCQACVQTFGFVAKYTMQTAVNKMVQGLLRLLIGWSIPISCAVLTFFVLDGVDNYNYNAMWPALVVFIASFIIADGICTVYDCCIDTIYLLSFEDMEREGGPKYMSEDLRAGFGIDPDTAEKESPSAAKNYRAVSVRRKQAGSSLDPDTARGGGESHV